MTARIINADCRDAMREMDADSIDAIVTDPPYGLSFMGREWDHGVPGVPFWAEALRVLKPGAHLLAFGGTRTFHRLTCAIEDAGFEIRDCVMWVYGSGFPKSLDVSKAIDKRRAEDVEPIRVVCRAVRAAMDARRLVSHQLTEHFGDCHPRLIDHWAARDTDSQPNLPTWAQWETLRDVLGMGPELDAEVWRLNGRKGKPGDAWENATVIGEHEGEPGGLGGERFTFIDKKIRVATAAARQWAGWGTALKPAWEPIIVARKPLRGTVAANVQQYGTGALNIDGCRVETDGRPAREKTGERWPASNMPACGSRAIGETSVGRWPANVILSYPEDEYEIRDDVSADQRRELYRWLGANA